MRKMIFALILALVPGMAAAQQGERNPRPMNRMATGGAAAAMLLAQRAELGLSAEQVARLEQIAASLEAGNKAHVEAMRNHRAERREGAEARERQARTEEERAAMRAAMDAVRTNVRTANDEARAVLTDEQRERLGALMKERREERGERMRGERRPPRDGRPGHAHPGGMQRDSIR